MLYLWSGDDHNKKLLQEMSRKNLVGDLARSSTREIIAYVYLRGKLNNVTYDIFDRNYIHYYRFSDVDALRYGYLCYAGNRDQTKVNFVQVINGWYVDNQTTCSKCLKEMLPSCYNETCVGKTILGPKSALV